MIKLLKFIILIFIVSIPFSRALLSITGVFIFAISIYIWYLNKEKITFKNKNYILLLILVGLCVVDISRTYTFTNWYSEILVKLPLILLPVPIFAAKQAFDKVFIKYILITFSVTISIASTLSVYNYLSNFDELNKLILQSKNIPVAGGMHHITFSVYCALAIFISAFSAIDFKLKWMYLIVILNVINLHILSTRTGLAGFYLTAIALTILAVLKDKKYLKYATLSIGFILLLPVTAFFTVKSFQNRIYNTLEDIKTTLHQSDANYKSMAMRVEATKTAFDLFKKNPIWGVGTGNLRKQMDIEYELRNSNLFLENRILPHNQFVLEAATHGLIGLIPFLFYIFFPLFSGFKKLSFSFISLWILIVSGMLFECFFERQHGVVLVSFFWFLFLSDNEKTDYQS